MIEALYIHIPYCVSRCAYCDFSTSACDDDARMDAYVEALSLQLRRASKADLLGAIKTIYIGGGTPTHLGSKRLNSLVYLISLSVNLENVVEFTCEVNPESIDERMVADLYALGVDRFSLGAQSFEDAELAAYGRAHDAADIGEAIEAIRTRTNNISLDLICGGPEQTMDSWRKSLDEAIIADVSHMSVYPLSLEEGTPLAKLAADGEAVIANEGLQADMMLLARDVLEEAGFARYEVAAYAKPGSESKHNLSYWTGKEYLGLGAAASSMLSVESFCEACDARIFDCSSDALCAQNSKSDDETPCRVRVSSARSDKEFIDSHGMPSIETECLSERESQVEDLMLGMRLSSGVPEERIAEIVGAREAFDDLVAQGLVRLEAGRYIPTDRGWLMGNAIFGTIWDLA